MKQRLSRYKHAWILLYAFIYLPWFCFLEKTVTSDYYIIHTWLDDWIPFNEYFVIPYLLWFPYVGGVILYFFLHSKEDYYRLCTCLFTGMTLSLAICTVFHNGTDLRVAVDPDRNLCARLVAFLHQADTSTNVFPSIHVFNSIMVHTAVVKSQRFRRGTRMASLVLAVLICLSTVFLKQHSVVDVMGGMLMAYGLYPLGYGMPYAARKKAAEKALG